MEIIQKVLAVINIKIILKSLKKNSYNIRIPIIPVITRDEVASLWDSLKENNLKDNKRLAYWQFIRHFGYSKESAAFTNSKKSPPKKGDNDMMLTSNKLGRDSILIRGSVQSKV